MFGNTRREGFETVVRAYANDVFRYLYWLCRDRSVAEDLSQETFTRAWSAWETQRDEKATKAWLFTIARNEHARLYEKKRLDIDPDVELDAIVSKSASRLTALDDQRLVMCFLRVVASAEEQRRAPDDPCAISRKLRSG